MTREVNNQLDSKPETKKLTRQEKDERLANCFFLFYDVVLMSCIMHAYMLKVAPIQVLPKFIVLIT